MTPSPSWPWRSTRRYHGACEIREAILALKKYPGAEGEYNFDQNGDGLHGYNVVRNERVRSSTTSTSTSTIDLPPETIVIARSQRVRPLAGPMINSATKQSSVFGKCWIASLALAMTNRSCFDGSHASIALPPASAFGAVYALVALGFVLIFRATMCELRAGRISMVAAI